MHACGHDVHMACLLGAVKILYSLKNEFEGSTKLIFQPSEEKFPGGAIGMINEGVLENPKVDMMNPLLRIIEFQIWKKLIFSFL